MLLGAFKRLYGELLYRYDNTMTMDLRVYKNNQVAGKFLYLQPLTKLLL
jgi:hypothetical protein